MPAERVSMSSFGWISRSPRSPTHCNCSRRLHIMISCFHRTLDHHFDKFRARPVECGQERRNHMLCLGDANCLESESLCNAGKINRRVDKVHADEMVTLVECQKSLLNDPVATIIHDHNRQW